jgi:hypothetical protein
MNCGKSALKLALVSAGAFLCLTPVLNAVAITQARSNLCPRNTYVYRYAETKNYFVLICATEGGNLSYISGAKNKQGAQVNLPLPSNGGQQFVAVYRNNRYILNRSYLRVTRGNQTLVNEKVLQWTEGRGLRD